MSGYPPSTPYDANYANQEQTSPSYLPPAYPNQYLQQDNGYDYAGQGNVPSNYGAYGYNQGIPPAPTFSPAAVASGIPPLPIYQDWNHSQIPPPSYSTPQHGVPYTNYPGDSIHDNSAYTYPAQHNYVPPTQDYRPHGESGRDEGEYEDPAEPSPTPNNFQASTIPGYHGTGYGDPAVYSRNDEYSPMQPSNYGEKPI